MGRSARRKFGDVDRTRDVYAPERWVDDAVFRPEVREAYRRFVEQGWTDPLRALHQGERIYTFWKYFRNAFAREPSGLAVTTAVRRSQRITLLHRLTLAEHVYANQNGRHGADHPTSTIATRQPEQQREDRGTGQRADLAE